MGNFLSVGRQLPSTKSSASEIVASFGAFLICGETTAINKTFSKLFFLFAVRPPYHDYATKIALILKTDLRTKMCQTTEIHEHTCICSGPQALSRLHHDGFECGCKASLPCKLQYRTYQWKQYPFAILSEALSISNEINLLLIFFATTLITQQTNESVLCLPCCMNNFKHLSFC